jgi:CheY-like chemotaxis protein
MRESLKYLQRSISKREPLMARKTILTVDDDPVVLEAINEVFKDEYNILMAHDGHEAIEMANQHDVDMILLDIMMPGFDGFSTLMLLKENPNTNNIPVVMVTAVGKKEKIISAFRDGAASYILKPFKADALRSKIESVLAASEREQIEEKEQTTETDEQKPKEQI